MSKETPPDAYAEAPPAEPRAGLAGVLNDRRVVPVTAALGAVALVVSLLSEWQVTTFDQSIFGDSEVGSRPLPSDVGDLGAWGAGYLVGGCALAAAVSLALFAPRPGRAYARVAAFAVGGVQLAILAGLVRQMGRVSFALNRTFTLTVEDEKFTVVAGRGAYCAFAGVLMLMLAVWLAARQAAGAEDAGQGLPGPAPTRDTDLPDSPLELTVTPSAPFQPAPGDLGTA